MVLTGAVIGIMLIGADQLLRKRGANFRVHVMPVAVGMYLPLTLIVPMLAGGIIRHLADKKANRHSIGETGDRGVLLSSGMIAGEALMGIIAAVFIVLDIKIVPSLPAPVPVLLSIMVMVGVVLYLYRKTR